METLLELSDSDYDKMAKDIETISKMKENEIYQSIGNALHRSGYTSIKRNGTPILTAKMFDDSVDKINFSKSFEFVATQTQLPKGEASSEGKKFWKEFEEKLQHEICTNKEIVNLITGNGTIKDYLVAGMPLIIVALGITSLSPTVLAFIAGVFALIIKVGFKTYCEID